MAANRRPLLFILMALCVLFAVGYAGRLAERTRLQGELVRMEEQIRAAQQQGLSLEAELADVTSNWYVERVAREELGLGLPGEKAVVIVAEPTEEPAVGVVEPEATSAAAPIVGEEAPVWRQWLDLFTARVG